MIRNERISDLHADASQARVEARIATEKANMLEAHAEGLHTEHPREFCPECEDKKNRT